MTSDGRPDDDARHGVASAGASAGGGGWGWLGAKPVDGRNVEFRVWAPSARHVEVDTTTGRHPLAPGGDGLHRGVAPGGPGDDYLFVLDGGDALPDPCSRWQPSGVRGPSRVVDLASRTIAPGPDLRLEELVVYELHVGTFTEEGTFDAVIPHLRALRELGVNALELMPVATFPGARGWGYDGLYVYAPHEAYGGPEGLARLVDAAHREGLAILLDVVYNHVGPGAEALSALGPYFTSRHATAWGSAIDYRLRGVREWAIGNAEMWTSEYRVDGLRLDAVHAVVDDSPRHVLHELRDRVSALLVSEMGKSDFTPLDVWGHDAMWHDALHHELHALLTGERDGYYEGFGSMEGLLRELGRPQRERLVVYAQNHDQVGNRALGDRLPADAHRVALAIVLFSLNTPLLFMGEEYDEAAPFQFFSDHVDPEIARLTREGRSREFGAFTAFSGSALPDPQDPATCRRSRLARGEPDALYRKLLALRAELPGVLEATAEGSRLVLRRGRAELRADLAARTVELRGA
jgi:maltooligosyltrehalose trehalohydrolase